MRLAGVEFERTEREAGIELFEPPPCGPGIPDDLLEIAAAVIVVPRGSSQSAAGEQIRRPDIDRGGTAVVRQSREELPRLCRAPLAEQGAHADGHPSAHSVR